MGFVLELITRSVDTGEQKTLETLTPANNLSPVSLTPVISYLPVSLTPVISYSPVSLTPVISYSPVSLTPAITFFPGVVVTGHYWPSLKIVSPAYISLVTPEDEK
jgi:hypothetical protein